MPKKEFVVKFVKGVAIFLVLCLAAYGAVVLLKPDPKIILTESDIAALEDIGIHVSDGLPDESGQSAIFGVEGAPPVGASTGTSSSATGSSTPPSFLGGQSALSAPAPAFIAAAPRVAVAGEVLPSAPDFFAPAIDVLPPPNFIEPADLPDQAPPFGSPAMDAPVLVSPPAEAPPFAPPPFEVPASEVPPFDSPLFEAPFETQAVPATESPPLLDTWDGITSNLSAMPPPAEFLHSPNPTPIAPPASIAAHTQFPAGTIPASPLVGEGIRRIRPDSDYQASNNGVYQVSDNQEIAFAPIESASDGLAPVSVHSTHIPPNPVRYTQMAARHSLAFEPVKREGASTAPVVAFVPPQQIEAQQAETTLQPAQPFSEQFEFEQFEPKFNSTPDFVAARVPNPAAVRQLGTPRRIENPTEQHFPAAPTQSAGISVESGVIPAESATITETAISETLERFVQTQRQWAESDDHEKNRLAFIHLSRLYEQDQLNEAERAMMQPILDSLALKVIYARDTHILEPAHQVKPGETVESIAKDFNIPAALLRKINGLAIHQEAAAGMMLKVVVGQFDAQISIKRQELTLLLGGLYAGQFPFTMPHPVSARSGEFFIRHKTDRIATMNNGWTLATVDAGNATFVFTDQDAREIFGILSEMSVIVLE